MFVVTGSQADRAEKNKITLLKLSDMHKTYVKPGRLVNYIHTLYLYLCLSSMSMSLILLIITLKYEVYILNYIYDFNNVCLLIESYT